MDEFQFINTIKQNVYRQNSLIKGIGDDAAVFRNSNVDIVTAVDTFVENIHFSDKTTKPFHIGYRALAANISDMAAMGAMPKYYLVSIVIPKNIDEAKLKGIFAGMNELAAKYQMDLIGGDTVSGEQLTLSITIIGFVPIGKARYRNEAKEDDVVFVTGTLGDASAGLHILLNELNAIHGQAFINKHQMPTPRVAFAQSLQRLKRLSLNDVSDGIANELGEIASASNVSIVIDDDRIPVSENLKQFSRVQQEQWKYYGGEDFELVGTVAEDDWPIVRENAEKLSIQVTKIGHVIKNPSIRKKVYVKKDEKVYPLEKLGYTHLK